MADARSCSVVGAVLREKIVLATEQLHVLRATQSLLQVLDTQTLMMLSRHAPAADQTTGRTIENPGSSAEDEHHNHGAERLDCQQQRGDSHHHETFRENEQTGEKNVECELIHFVDGVANELRRVALDVKCVRLPKVDREEPLREIGLHVERELGLSPNEKRQEYRLDKKQNHQGQHTQHHQMSSGGVSQRSEKRLKMGVFGRDIRLHQQGNSRKDRSDSHGFQDHADDHEREQRQGAPSFRPREKTIQLRARSHASKYPRYHSTNRATPSFTGVVGLYPTCRASSLTSANVLGTSPGWSGSSSLIAFFPTAVSMASMYAVSCTGLLFPMLKIRNGASLVAGSGWLLSHPRFGEATFVLARITPSTMSST